MLLFLSSSPSPSLSLLAPPQFSHSVALAIPMEAPLQAHLVVSLEPVGSNPAEPPQVSPTLSPASSLEADISRCPPAKGPPLCHILNSPPSSHMSGQEATPPADQPEESLVDSKPILFSENPFLVANRKSRGYPPEQHPLSGPPVGYGRQGQLQTSLYSKARGRVTHRHGYICSDPSLTRPAPSPGPLASAASTELG